MIGENLRVGACGSNVIRIEIDERVWGSNRRIGMKIVRFYFSIKEILKKYP